MNPKSTSFASLVLALIIGVAAIGLLLVAATPLSPASAIGPAVALFTAPQSEGAARSTLLAAQPTGLTASHRSGQTFLTWNEDTTTSGESYHVYRHTAPIDASNIDQATRLTDKWGPLPEGSSIFYTDRDRAGNDNGDERVSRDDHRTDPPPLEITFHHVRSIPLRSMQGHSSYHRTPPLPESVEANGMPVWPFRRNR